MKMDKYTKQGIAAYIVMAIVFAASWLFAELAPDLFVSFAAVILMAGLCGLVCVVLLRP